MNQHRESQRKRAAGLPSGKTISDFALSPYAGFMSQKEVEWLIKIQIFQCQNSGNPYEDDYYFTARYFLIHLLVNTQFYCECFYSSLYDID